MMERHYLLSCLCAYTWVATIAPSCKFLEGLTNHEAMTSFSYFYFLILHACSFPVASHCMDGDFFRVFRPQGDRRFILKEFGRNKRSFLLSHFFLLFLKHAGTTKSRKDKRTVVDKKGRRERLSSLWLRGKKQAKQEKGSKRMSFHFSSFSFLFYFIFWASDVEVVALFLYMHNLYVHPHSLTD